MNNTLKTLSTLITKQYQEMTLEQLAVAYKTEELNPSILATAFSKTFNLIITTSRNFFGLTEADIASYSLECLDKSLQMYNSSKGAFSTLFTTVLRNRLRQETEALSTDKRKASLFSDSYEQIFETTNRDIEAPAQQETGEETLQLLAKCGLTKRELQYCNLIIKGYKNSEIAEMFGVSIMTITNIKKQLRKKLTPQSLCFA